MPIKTGLRKPWTSLVQERQLVAELDRETVGYVWAGTLVLWLVLVFIVGWTRLGPMIFGLFLGGVAGGIVTLIAGHSWGLAAFVGAVLWYAWYVYNEPER